MINRDDAFGVCLAPWQASLERCPDRLAVQMELPAC
jgi:hypothetical protein